MEHIVEDFETDSGKKVCEAWFKEHLADSMNNFPVESLFWGGVKSKYKGFLIDKTVNESYENVKALEEHEMPLTKANTESYLNCCKLKKEVSEVK